MSRRALNHLARSLVEVLAEDEQREQQMLQMQQALMQQAQGVRPMVMGPGPFGFLMQQPVLQFQQPVRAVEEMAATTPKAPSPAAAVPGGPGLAEPPAGSGAAVAEEVGGRGQSVHGPAGGTGHAAATNAGIARGPAPIEEESPDSPGPVEPAPSRPEASEKIVAPRYRSATPVEGCSAKSAPTARRVSTTPAASEGEGSSRLSEGTRCSSMILFFRNSKL